MRELAISNPIEPNIGTKGDGQHGQNENNFCHLGIEYKIELYFTVNTIELICWFRHQNKKLPMSSRLDTIMLPLPFTWFPVPEILLQRLFFPMILLFPNILFLQLLSPMLLLLPTIQFIRLLFPIVFPVPLRMFPLLFFPIVFH